MKEPKGAKKSRILNALLAGRVLTPYDANEIGKTTDGNDRVVMNDYEKRFLEPSQSDGLHQMFE